MMPAVEQPGASPRPGGVVLFGVPVRFHFTFVLLALFILVGAFSDRRSAAEEGLFLIILFLSVLFHELGHAIVGRIYGIRTIEIIMYPIGGVARLERQPEPGPELRIALAGPAVNLLIAAMLIAIEGGPSAVFKPKGPETLLGRAALWNIYLAAFNLVPALPMDGGRALRAAIALWRGEAVATRIAANTGKILAIIMGIYGLVNGEMFLLLVALLIYMSASHEGAASQGRALTQGIPVSTAMVTDFKTLPHGATLREAADMLIATSQHDFPVVHGDEVIGLLDRNSFVRGMATDGPDSFVSGVMDREFLRLEPATDLAEAMARVNEAGACGLVMDAGRLVGLLTSENISEFLMLRKLGVAPDPRHAA